MTARGDLAALRPIGGAELAQVLESHQRWLAGDEQNGKRATFQGRALRGANLAGVDLRYADFRETDLSGTDLSGAELMYTDFTGAVLQDVRLHESDLINATLCDAESLSAKSLAGSLLTNAELPDAVAKFDALGRTWEIASRSSNTFIAVLGACVYCWLTIATTNDVRMITNSASSPLPVFGTEIPIVGFYWAGPIILLGAHLYVHIYLQRLWQGYARLPAVFPDGMALDQKAFPWLLSSLVQFNVRRLRGHQRLSTCFDHILSVILAWWVVPFTLTLFWLRYLPRHDWVGTAWHILLIGIAAASSQVTYRLASRTLREIAHPRPDTYVSDQRSVWSHGWRALRRYRPSLSMMCVIGALLLVSLGAINGAPGKRGGGWPERIVPDLLHVLGFHAVADFRDADVSTRPLGWSGHDIAQIAGAALQEANLRYADMRKAFLVGANLRSADLQGADIRKSNLEGADMDEANLRGADIAKANLANVNLEEADLENADLYLVNLAGSILTRANVRNANFDGATLEVTRLDETDLRAARNLTRAQLARACADLPPQMPPEFADLRLAPCPPEQGLIHRRNW